MKLRTTLLALAPAPAFALALALAAPAFAHLKMPKEAPSALVEPAPGSPAGTLYYCGYSHIDFNWLWDWADTVHVWDGTASTALNLMYRFPDFHFGETQAAAYMAIERIRPDMFKDIQGKVASGQWSLLGGMWDESDTNLPSGEGLARSFLYAQDYFQEKFGKQPTVGFLPDSFGHTRQLPQIMQQAEIPNFFFQRCPTPKHLFWWKAPDGSKVLAYSSPGWYNEKVTQSTQTKWPATIKSESGVNMAMVVFGVGDHGGGPTITDLTALEMLKTDPTFPEVREAAPEDFYNAARAAEPTGGFPSWNTDLQYTFEGCYTTHGDMKKMLRNSENDLYATETLATLASLYGGNYPVDDLRAGWRISAFNHFHDIAPGTAIHSTYEEVANKQKLLKQTTAKVAEDAWSVLEPHVDTTGDGQPLVLFNPLSWSRTDPVEATLPFDADTPNVSVIDSLGNFCPAQVTGREVRDGKVYITFVFVATVPSMGYRVFHVKPVDTLPEFSNPLQVSDSGSQKVITTSQLTVNVDTATGQVSRLYDNNAKVDVIPSGQSALRLAVLPEDPSNSAWNIVLKKNSTGAVIPPTYLDTPTSFQVLETGPVRARFRATYQNGNSTYTQDITVYRGLPRVDAHLAVDFHDYDVFVKSVIPTSLSAPSAYFDGPFYAMNRPTDGHLDVPQQKWMDESQGTTYGLSVLNDCKYGADVSGGTMRLSLLRGTHDPDKIGDVGAHSINYSLYPHPGDWRAAGTMREGYEYNVRIRIMPCTVHGGDLGGDHSFLVTNVPNAVITAFKRAEDGNGYVLRYYETNGANYSGSITFPRAIQSVTPVNLLEHTQPGTIYSNGSTVSVTTSPYRIQTLRVVFAPRA